MTDIDELREKIRREDDSAKQRVASMQVEAADQSEQLQSRFKKFLAVSQQVREALRPRVEAFAEALPGATPSLSRRDIGPGGRGFHGVLVSFATPRSERCPANLILRFELEAGPSVEHLVLSYDLEILPVLMEFERQDRAILPLDPSSVERAVEWFDQKAITFTRTYISMLFNPHYQKGAEVPDLVLGMSFPRPFAKAQAAPRAGQP